MNTPIRTRASASLGGVLYIIASVCFLIIFSWLAARFGYPDVLDQPAARVLPDLLALGNTGRAVWVAYAFIPLMLIPAAVGAAASFRRSSRSSDSAIQLGMVLQIVAAFAMTLGLARWSTAQWSLAEVWKVADSAQHVPLAAVFDALNSYLGNAIGEFVGELALNGSFAAFSLALWRTGGRRMAGFGFLTAFAGWVGMFRNMTSIVQPAADVTNFLLPLFLIAFGATILRQGRSRDLE